VSSPTKPKTPLCSPPSPISRGTLFLAPTAGDEHHDDHGELTISGELTDAHNGVFDDATGSYTLLSAPWTHLKGQMGEPRHGAQLTTVMAAWLGGAHCHDSVMVTWVARQWARRFKRGTQRW
jgi:hypothetical protein